MTTTHSHDPGRVEQPNLRVEMAQWAREEVLEAGLRFLAEVHDVDFHNYGDGSGPWQYDASLEELAADVTQLVEQVLEVVASSRAAIGQAMARRAWLLSGAPLRCGTCGDGIDPTYEPWLVCVGWAEHAGCHDEDPAREAEDREFTLVEDEYAGYGEQRMRDGGPFEGDLVQVQYRDGRILQGTWNTRNGRRGLLDVDGTRHDLDAEPVAPIRWQIVDLAEDLASYGPADADETTPSGSEDLP